MHAHFAPFINRIPSSHHDFEAFEREAQWLPSSHSADLLPSRLQRLGAPLPRRLAVQFQHNDGEMHARRVDEHRFLRTLAATRLAEHSRVQLFEWLPDAFVALRDEMEIMSFGDLGAPKG